jgi:hypothetical protein
MPDVATAPVVEPNDPNAAQPAPVEPAQDAPQQAEQPAPLPADLLKIPALQALVAGSPPALSMKLKGSEDRSEVALVKKHQEPLQQAGMGFYRSISGEYGVMFNALRIHPADLQAADKAGKLLLVAPDFDAVDHAVAKAGLDHPALHASPPPRTPAMPQSAQAGPPQMSSGKFSPPVPASVARRLIQQRITNMQPSAPTGGPAPGAGPLTNAILKPVI